MSTCITYDIVRYCVRLYVSIVFNYRILCAIVLDCVDDYMVSYGDLVSANYNIKPNITIKRNNNQPYHITYSINLTVL